MGGAGRAGRAVVGAGDAGPVVGDGCADARPEPSPVAIDSTTTTEMITIRAPVFDTGDEVTRCPGSPGARRRAMTQGSIKLP
jgi:hypothetical protein